jgi:casein kinase II subunit alpha
MHRDIKPQNIAIDKRKHRLRLLDWGLADFYHPRQKYNSHVATRIFKPPELLINYPYYDYSMDIWSTGITFSIMMLRRWALECGEDDSQQLIKVAQLVGGKGIIEYAQSLGITLDDKTVETLRRTPGHGWDLFCQKAVEMCPPEAVDLLKQMTTIDHRQRITASEALKHPFFAPLTR